VVARAAGEAGALVTHPAGQYERPGADRPTGDGRGRLDDLPWRNHPQPGLRQHIEKRRIRFAQGGFEGERIDHPAVQVRRDVGSRQRRLGLRVAHVFEVDPHRFRVEALAVAEGDVVAQVEGVGQAVGADRPALRQPRREGAILGLVDQAVEQGAAHPLHVAVGQRMDVEAAGIGRCRYAQGPAALAALLLDEVAGRVAHHAVHLADRFALEGRLGLRGRGG